MTMEEGKGKRGKKRKRLAGDEAGNRPSSGGESSEQLEEGKKGKMQTGTANEPGNKRRPGRRPLPPPSEEEMERKRKKKNEKDRLNRKKKKSQFISLQERQELFKEFCEKLGITEKFETFCEDQRKLDEALGDVCEKLEEELASQYYTDEEIQMLVENFSMDPEVTLGNLEMIPTELEGATAVNSSCFGARGTPFERARELKRKREEELDGARGAKRPATAYATPSRPPIGGFMAEARLNNRLSTAALATHLGPLFSTKKGTQIQTREAAHDKEASSSQAPPQVELRKFTDDELGQGSKKEVSVYNLVKQYGKLKDAERRQQEAVAEADNRNKQVKGLKDSVSKLKAELADKGKIPKDALELEIMDAVILGWNLMKELLQSMPAGSEFLNLPLLDAIEHYPSLENQFNEGLTLIGQGHPIDDKVAIQSDDPPVVVPRSFVYYDASMVNVTQSVPAGSEFPNLSLFDASELYPFNQFNEGLHLICQAQPIDDNIAVLNSDTSMVNVGGPNDFAPVGDAANIAVDGPQFQAANPRANHVEQEDDAND